LYWDSYDDLDNDVFLSCCHAVLLTVLAGGLQYRSSSQTSRVSLPICLSRACAVQKRMNGARWRFMET